MANEEHLKILKQGVRVWNQWRITELSGVIPDLSGADLRRENLCIYEGNLIEADLRRANLCGANFAGTNLSFADLSGADLSGANLYGTQLNLANLSRANLDGVDISYATINNTVFADVDLSNVKGLQTLKHKGPSAIGIETIYRSRGKLSEVFLRKAGVPDTFIEFMHSLAGKAFEFYSCFISYSGRDQEFAERLHADLQSNAVRCWFASEDLKIGDPFRQRIDEAIRIHDKLMVVLSENSMKSVWVEKEVESAFEKERQQNRIILFPIRLDETVMETNYAWAADIRRTRHIGDFRKWRDHDSYKRAFNRLLRDLRAKDDAKSAAALK